MVVLSVVAAFVVVTAGLAALAVAKPPPHTGSRKADSDGDGLSNWTEIHRTKTNPRKADTDGDGLSDWTEVHRTKTNPRKADTDGDGLSDWTEVHRTKTNPRKADTDGDGLSDWTEVHRTKTNPRKADSDGDGFKDGEEVFAGTGPWDPASFPTLRLAVPAPAGFPAPVDSSPPPPSSVEALWTPPRDARVAVPVELDGSGSTGDGPLECTWSFENQSGSTVFDTEEGCAIDFTFESSGTKYVRLTVSDSSGDSASNKQSFVVASGVDTTPPDTSIVSGPSGTTSSTSASFGFNSTESSSSFECRLDSGTFSACSSPRSYTGLAEGAHSFSVRATDAAGNVDPTPATRSWTIDTSVPPDTTPPDTSIVSGPSGTTSSTSASFSFNSTEAGSSFECKLDSGSFAACISPKSYSSLAEGTHTFSVQATDPSGNVDPTAATRSWTVEASSAPPPNCFPVPSSCGYPDPTNTGVPAGTTLTPSDAITASTAGQVIEGKDVSGGINVRANNVTIQNSRVSSEGDCGSTNACGNWAIRIEAGVTGTVIRNVETVATPGTTCEHDIRNTSSGTVEIVGSYLHACDSNVYSVGNTTLRDSYSIAKIEISTDHVENVYFNNSTFAAIHSTLLNPVSQTAVIFGNVNSGSGGTCSNHLTIEESLLAGGGYTLYPCGNGSSAGSSTWVVQNNHFARCLTSAHEVSGGHWVCQSGFDQYGYYPRGGSFGLDSYSFSTGRTWSGNVWDDNLASISAP